MRPRARNVVKVLFILAFFVTAPVVLMFTSGYRYNWKRQRIQKTGNLRAETEPPGAQVSLDGVPQQKTTPTTYSRLLPEELLVRMEKKGYLPWEKTLEVRSGETTFATGVVLYKDVLPRLVLDRHVVAAAWSPDGKDVAFLADDGGWKELVALGSGGKPTLLARFAHDAYPDASITWSPDGAAVLLSSTDAGATQAFRFLPSTPNSALAVHENFPKGPLTVHWNDDGSSLMVVSSLGAFTMDPQSGAVAPLRLEPGIIDADTQGRSTYMLRAQRGETGPTVVLERLNGDAAEPVLELPAGAYRFLRGDGGDLLIAETKKHKIVLVDAGSGAAQTYDATASAWDPKGRRLLLWNDFEIFTVNPADGGRTLVTRLGAPIGECAWTPGGDAIVFSTTGGIAVAELDDRDRRNVFDLIRFTNVGPFTVDAAANVLRFVGSVGNQSGVYERDL